MNVGRPPVRRPVSSSTPRISSLSSPGGNKQARSCTRYHPRGAWCAHRDDDEEGGTERNEKTKRKRSIVSCKYVGRVHMRAVLEGQPRSKEETERESWSRFSDGRSAVCSQENGSREYRWCSIDGGALLELWPRTGGKKDMDREGRRKGCRGVKEGRPWNHLIGDFASRPSIRWRYRIGSGRLRQVMATALLRFPPTCRGKRAEMRKIVAGAPLIARSLRGHACTRTDARVGDGNV